MTAKYQLGDMLIAPPGMTDSRFNECVLLVTQDTNQGVEAMCLNKSSGHSVNEVIEPLGLELDKDLVLYWGGPVGLNTVWMLHSSEWASDNTYPVNDSWSLTSNMTMFHNYVNGNRPLHSRFIIGHSSWAPGQLEMELEGEGYFDSMSSWLIAQAPPPQEVFTLSPTRVWRKACELAGHQAVSSWLA